MDKICHPWNSDALYLFIKGLFYNSTLYMSHYSLPGLPLCSVSSWRFVSTLNSWTPNCRKIKFWDSRRCPDLRRKQKNVQNVLVLLLSFYLFIWPYLFIFWSVRFCIKFGWNFFIFIFMLIKITETRFNSEPVCCFCINIFWLLFHFSPLSYSRHFSLGLWLPFLVLCSERGSQWGGGFYGYRLKFWLFYGYRLFFFSYG